MLELDGSLGEGGGQILRSSLTLALLIGQAFRLCNIRARRSKPGLQPQHLTAVRAAAEVGQAQTRGASVGSETLEFAPQTVRPGDYRFAIGTAGATTLVLQTIHLPLALQKAPSTVTVEGGTHNDHSPCFHFLDVTWRGYMSRLKLPLTLTMVRPGFYPRGGGQIVANIPGHQQSHNLRQMIGPTLDHAIVLSAAAGLPEHVAHRQARRARVRLEDAGLQVEVREEQWPGGPGSMLAVTLPQAPVPTLFFGLGARGKRAEAVADEAVSQVLAYVAGDAPVDEHSADQLILPLAFAEGPSEYRTNRVTRHLLTNIEVLRRFLPRPIECEGDEGEPGTVRIGA